MKTVWCTLALAVLAVSANAANYTVKSGGGGNYTTIQACANVAVAGDTCTVYAGSYAGWAQPTSGSSGNLITFVANAGDTVTVTSAITISSRSYIRISGLRLSLSSGTAIVGNNSTAHNQIDHNTAATTLLNIPAGGASTGSDNIISYNVVNLTAHTDNAVGFNVYGDRNLFDHNEIKNGEGDCHNVGGTNVVIRYEYCHDINGASGEHIDFVQVIGGVAPTLSFSLIEHNVYQHCYNDGGNCHTVMVRASGGQVADTLIVRYNYTQNMDGGGIGIGSHTDGPNTTPNGTIYNNTLATEALSSENGSCFNFDSGPGNAANNICYNAMNGPWSPTIFSYGGRGNGDLTYTSGYSGNWNSPYSTETAYASLKNQNPLFANYPTDATLQAGSPAINAGVALTTASGSGSGSTSLTVVNSHFFQPGWAGAQADWIRIGSSTTVKIASINYSTNVITLASPATWSNGANIYLYKDSSGNVVLSGENPDVGAAIAPATDPMPEAPTGLVTVVR